MGCSEQTAGRRLSIYPACRRRVCGGFTKRATRRPPRLVHASDVDETIAPISIGSIGAENVYSFVLAELVPCDFRLGSKSEQLRLRRTSPLVPLIADIQP